MKLRILLSSPFLLLSVFSFGQLPVPYSNSFDTPANETGWTHMALSGTDDWEMGTPSGNYINSAYSNPGAWKTNLEGQYNGYSSRVLVTPSFDFTNLPTNFCLSFVHKRHSFSTASYYLEYSTNNGGTWTLFNPSTILKKGWQSASGFGNTSQNYFSQSSVKLTSLQGQPNVMFRFRFNSNAPNGDGWLIDDFSIAEEYYNVYGTTGDTIVSSTGCSDFTVTTTIGYDNAYTQSFSNTTNYFLSTDNVFDVNDQLLGTRTGSISNNTNWDKILSMPADLNAGDYYIFYQHDALNVRSEANENDNVGFAILHLDSVYALPFNDDFESDNDSWTTYLNSWGVQLLWEANSGISHHLEGAHSGVKSWNTSKSIHSAIYNCGNFCNIQYLESPYFNLNSSTGQKALSFWYKNTGYNSLEYSSDCEETWTELYFFSGTTPNDDWTHMYMILDGAVISDATKFRFKFQDSDGNYEGISIDDFYVGPVLPDLSVEEDKLNRFTTSAQSSAQLKFKLANNGELSSDCEAKFYWSNDSVFDGGDFLIHTLELGPLSPSYADWQTISFSKPTTVSGTYYIIYKLDAQNEVVEMRENNNEGYFTLYQYNEEFVPYFSDFESNADGWRHNSTLGSDAWQWGQPNGNVLDTAFSGINAFYTDSPGNYLDSLSRMHLYTPVFNFSNVYNAVMYFDMKLDQGSYYNGGTNMSYSVDGGATWQVLDVPSTSQNGFNRWYYPMVENGWGTDEDYYLPNTTEIMFDLVEKAFANFQQYNSKDVKRNTRYIIDISQFAGESQVQFRYNLAVSHNHEYTSLYQFPSEGVMIDNFGIKARYIDLSVDYKKAVMNSSEVDSLKFFMNISNNGLRRNNATSVDYYLSTDTILSGNDYLLGNATIKVTRPDMSDYINNVFKSPENLSDYKYLVYDIDPDNLNNESNEDNNVGYWLLALDSIHEYPYFNDFNDSIVDGWYQYSKGPYTDTISDLRFRNMLAPSEYLYSSYKRSGEWFTDNSSFGDTYQAPKFFLQSPAFSFENVDSVKLSFDLFCKGGSVPLTAAGGQMQFSTDGGDHFSVLTSQYGAHHNWYNYTGSTWGISNIYLDTAILDSTYFDLTFLRGEKNVVLQYTFISNGTQANTPQGMRMDNFLIEGIQLDYIPLDSMVDVAANLSMPTIDIDYSIANIGEKDGRDSETKFYWSTDEFLDENDVLMDSVSHLPIEMNDTLDGQITLTYPTPILNQVYYILYMADSENNVKEAIEDNNVGSYKIEFDAFINYKPLVELDSVTILDNELMVTVDYVIENTGFLDGSDFNTSFYWSLDDILDVNDELLEVETLTGVSGQDQISSSVEIDCPVPFTQDTYYVLYFVDEDSIVVESNEGDNLGKLKVIIQSTATTSENESLRFIGINGNSIYFVVPDGQLINSQFILINMLGQEIVNRSQVLQNGLNEIKIPENIVFGMYMLYLNSPTNSVGWKVMVGSNY